MSETKTTYNARFYIKNPGGAYDPAPLHEFDLDLLDAMPCAMVGDTICATSRIGSDPNYRTDYYKVVDRTIRFDPQDIFIYYMVERVPENWTHQFNQ